MKIDIFILGVLAEHPANRKRIDEIADFVNLSKWIFYKEEDMKKALIFLEKKGYINEGNLSVEDRRRIYSISDEGRKFYRNRLSNYLQVNNLDFQLLILFIIFSSHVPKIEVLKGIESKIKYIEESMILISTLDNQRAVNERNSFIEAITLESMYRYKNMELELLKKFYNWAKEKESWTEFLSLNDMWIFRV